MKTRWFGEPWPCAEDRAPVCEDESDRLPVPIGFKCLVCDRAFKEGDQGVVMPYAGPAREEVTFTVVVDDELERTGNLGRIQNLRVQQVAAEHLVCFLTSILYGR